MNRRKELIGQIHEVEQEADKVRSLLCKEQDSKWRQLYQKSYNDLRVKRLCLISQLSAALPLTMEGYLGEDCEEVGRDEHGSIRQVYHYLGCPSFSTSSAFNYGRIQCDDLKDITNILQNNIGKYLRITIEAIEIGERAECEHCNERFKCLTTKVKA